MKTPQTIISVCAKVVGCRVNDMFSPHPPKRPLLAKQLAAWFMRQYGESYQSIAAHCHLKSHVSAINAVRNVDARREIDSWTRDHLMLVRARLERE